MTGNELVVGEGLGSEAKILFAGFYQRGERRQDLERAYFDNYYPWDERLPRLRQLPDGRLVHVTELYSAAELKTSRTYNEGMRRSGAQNSLNVRLDGPDGSRIVWALADPVGTDGWQSAQTRMIERLLPHIRQYVQVRRAMTAAEELGASLTGLLNTTRIGVIHLDRRGRILEANSRAPPAAAQRRRAVRPGRFPAHQTAGRQRPFGAAAGACAAGLRGQSSRQRFHDGAASARPAAAGGAHHPGGCPPGGTSAAGASPSWCWSSTRRIARGSMRAW